MSGRSARFFGGPYPSLVFVESKASQSDLGSPSRQADPASVGRFHHIGYVVSSIEGAVAGMAKSLEADWDGAIIHDPLQTTRVAFLYPKIAANPVIELVEPVGPDSTVSRFLKRGGGLHHLCYEVDSVEQELERARARRDVIVRPPFPAAAFNQRKIAWVYTRTRLLIEYLEKDSNARDVAP